MGGGEGGGGGDRLSAVEKNPHVSLTRGGKEHVCVFGRELELYPTFYLLRILTFLTKRNRNIENFLCTFSYESIYNFLQLTMLATVKKAVLCGQPKNL